MNKNQFFLFFLFLSFLSFAQEKTDLKWWDPNTNDFNVIAGQAWPGEVQSTYHRLPARIKEKIRKPVWSLSKQAAGLSIRFWSNAPKFNIKYKVKGDFSMPHMPATGVSGLDLYSKSNDGEWLRCWGGYRFGDTISYNFKVHETSTKYAKFGREYQLFLPLYNEVELLEIGIETDFFINGIPIRKEKPIIFYGTSITQGACASRPGMAYTSILERKLERPIINLGFSGNGRLEPALIDLMAEIDSKLYILDCLPNLNPHKDDVYQLVINAVKKLKSVRPKTPIILTAHPGYSDNFTNFKTQEYVETLNETLSSAFQFLKSQGFTEIHLLEKDKLALDSDSFVDKIHPNDVGMVQYAEAYEGLIRTVINEPIGNLSTTIPVSQSRDISTYNWETRHQEILQMNDSVSPEICFFGNSIVHFWAGEPNAPIQRGLDSWNKHLSPFSIKNFGFGWDRIENVLWRVYHDELDGINPQKIVLMLGTNNLHINTDKEIIAGLDQLIDAIKFRLPESSILLVGILPRRDGEERLVRLNRQISQLARSKQLSYVDIGEPLVKKNGHVDETLFTDGLHPNKKGYKLLAKKLQKYLKKN